MDPLAGKDVRLAGYRALIDRRVHLATWQQLVQQLECEPDQALANEARVYLIEHGRLPDVLLDRAQHERGFGSPRVQRKIAEQRAMRLADGEDEVQLLEAARSGFRSVQSTLLELDVLPRSVVLFLAASGATHVIRNRAKRRLAVW
ncbi:MAG: hypothetical protein ACRDJO_08370 [Actinomycetota bacterium]